MAGQIKVDHNGFRKRVAWRGLAGVLSELISNALDENVSYCNVECKHLGGQDYSISVEDDSPDGFRNLEESYTLYADSYKASLADKSGRFNVGEKVAIVICDECRIESTTGTRIFEKDTPVKKSPKKRERGTLFTGKLRATREQYDKAVALVQSIIARPGVQLVFNGLLIKPPTLVTTVTAVLPTITANEDGVLMKTARKAEVHIYSPLPGQQGAVYELGIPVVSVEHPFVMDVRQKVPLSVDRNNVTPGFYRKLCAAVLDGTADVLTEEQARSRGVTEGIAEAKSNEAVIKVMELQHGEKRFVPDPNNREGNGTLYADDYTPVHGGTYDKLTWSRIREAGAIKSVNEYVPKPESVSMIAYEDELTDGMKAVATLTKLLANKVLGKACVVKFTDNRDLGCVAQGGGDLNNCWVTYHVGMLGKSWFSDKPLLSVANLELICHELAHHNNAQDCTREHANEMGKIMAHIIVLVQTHPELFADFQ